MDKRFPKKGNAIYELRWPQDENGYDKEAFRVKCFRSYSEYWNDEDPLFYFENADSIVAPAFYAPFKQQEIDKPPKFILVEGFDDMISEETMKEAFCLWDGNFEATEENFFSSIFPDYIDMAMFTNGQTIRKAVLAEPYIDDVFLEKKWATVMLAQGHGKQTNIKRFTKTITVKNPDTNEEFKRVVDKAQVKSDFNKENFRITTRIRKIPSKKSLRMYDDRALFASYYQLNFIKISPDEVYDVDEDKEKDCSFFQLVLNAFYFEEQNALIYKQRYGTAPISHSRSLKDLKNRKKKGWSLQKLEFQFSSFIKDKFSALMKGIIFKIKHSFVIFDFTYLTSGLKVVLNRLYSGFTNFPFDLAMWAIRFVWWIQEELAIDDEIELIKSDKAGIKATSKKIRYLFVKIHTARIPKKPIKERINLIFNNFKKDIKEKYFKKRKK